MRTNYNKRFDYAHPGTIQGMGNQPGVSVKALVNGSGGAKEQWTITTPATPAANSIYGINIDGVLIQFETGTATTQAQLVAGFNIVFRSNMQAGSKVDLEVNGTDLVFSAKSYEERHRITVVSGTGLTASKTVDTSIPETVGYGVIVVRVSGDKPHTARLPTGDPQEKALGFTLAPYDKEWNSLDPNAKPGFEADMPMEVCDRTNGADGGWLHCIESDITEDDTVYYSYAAGTRGWITKNPTDAVDISAIASIQEGTRKYQGENYLVCVRFNQV